MEKLDLLDYKTKEKAIAGYTHNLPNEPEMSDFDSAFLCGLLEKYRPSKIVEVGVAAGGTTGIIIEKLKDRYDEINMYSCDLNEQFYLNEKVEGGNRKSGFLAEDIIRYSNVKHRFMLGNYLPTFLDEIGQEIDFLILDTVHYMPGELLDFLAVMPFLKDGAIVVLHDVRFNLINARSSDGMATNVLFSAVVANKIYNGLVEDGGKIYANIAAFIVTSDTKKYIDNVFQALFIPWYFPVDDNEKHIYSTWYKRYYKDEYTKLFEYAVNKQNALLSTKSNCVRAIFRQIRNGDPVLSMLYKLYRRLSLIRK